MYIKKRVSYTKSRRDTCVYRLFSSFKKRLSRPQNQYMHAAARHDPPPEESLRKLPVANPDLQATPHSHLLSHSLLPDALPTRFSHGQLGQRCQETRHLLQLCRGSGLEGQVGDRKPEDKGGRVQGWRSTLARSLGAEGISRSDSSRIQCRKPNGKQRQLTNL